MRLSSARWLQRWLPRCNTMQCHVAMCGDSRCHIMQPCAAWCTRAQLVSRVGHEHHRDAESQVERRRPWSRGSVQGRFWPSLDVTCVQRKCSGVRAFYFALSTWASQILCERTWWMFGQSNCRWWRRQEKEKEEEARACSCLAPMNASHDVAEK